MLLYTTIRFSITT